MTETRRRTGLLSQLGVQLVLAILLGVALGRLLGPRATMLGELGALVVRLLKALATPLVFCAVVDAVARAPITGKMGLRLIVICLTNTTVAAMLAVGLAIAIAPGHHADPGLATRLGASATTHAEMSLHDALESLFPESLLQPFVANQVLTVVLLALATGLALRRLGIADGQPGARLAALAHDGLAAVQLILHAIVRVVPLAILGVVARVVGQSGFELFGALGALVGTVTLGLALHVAVYYSLLVRLAGRRPLAFWRAAARPLLTSLSLGSSMATLPVTLETLDGELAVGPAASRLAACVGTNFNNDGIMLYEVVAAIFIAQLTGHALGASAIVSLCATSAFAAAGIAGVPEAGLITLALVLQAARLPTELLPVLLSVDWLLGRLRAATNVASDLVVSAVLDAGSPKTPG
jgi:DAACS family dicarboxylate/amino acid:cation (Na+ or H+) symporter